MPLSEVEATIDLPTIQNTDADGMTSPAIIVENPFPLEPILPYTPDSHLLGDPQAAQMANEAKALLRFEADRDAIEQVLMEMMDSMEASWGLNLNTEESLEDDDAFFRLHLGDSV